MFPVFVAFVYASATLGPVLGFGCGAALMEVYVDFATPEVINVQLTPTDSQWVGAWWVGFLIFGALTILSAPPFFAFPKSLPDPSKVSYVYEDDVELKSSLQRSQMVNSASENFTNLEKRKREYSRNSAEESRWTSFKREFDTRLLFYYCFIQISVERCPGAFDSLIIVSDWLPLLLLILHHNFPAGIYIYSQQITLYLPCIINFSVLFR